MQGIPIRDYFAANADISWIKSASPGEAFRRTGVDIPNGDESTNPQQWVRFWVKVEIAWRWRYANLMMEGSERGL